MPTAVQRQRAAALAQLNQHQQRSHPSNAAVATTSKQQQSQQNARVTDSSRPSTSKLTTLEADWEDGAFSDEDSDEEASAFEMDGQDAWTQNYCSICDTLIEPGQGLNAKREDRLSGSNQQHDPPPASTAARNSLPSSGLKSKSGTIKARPPSSDGGNGHASNFKRSNSAGRIHAVGVAGPLGPSKRTGSAGSRLNALSELRPTTRLNAEAGKGKNSPANPGSPGTKSPALSRRSSTVSVRSGHSGAAGADESHPSSPTSPGSALSRSKKGGILGNLTPAALKQQEELETARIKAPPALYCSERCRQIDEQRSSGMGELIYYLQQPTSPTSAMAWQSGPSSYGACSSRTSSGNIPALARGISTTVGAPLPVSTPESECMCADCLDKNSISGTVPSGASDTAESSASYQPYGPRAQKQRTQSGRIVTPLNLHPSGVHWSTGDYFGNATHASQRARQVTGDRRAHRDSMSQAGTASSTKSSDSGSDLWEPNLHRRRGETSYAERTGKVSAKCDSASLSTTSDAAERGTTTTGTVTPEGNRLAGTDSLALMARYPSERPSTRGSDVSGNLSSSSTNPIRLLRQIDQMRAAASVDVSADSVSSSSPQTSAYGVLSHSMASERTEGAASSGFTTVAPQPSSSLLAASLLERRQIGRPFTLDLDGAAPSTSGSATDKVSNVNVEHYRFTDSPAPFDKSTNGSRAIGTLKKHVQGQSSTRQSGFLPSVRASGQTGRLSISSNGETAPAVDDRNHDSSSGSWFRSSISAAWNTLRGIPPTDDTHPADGRRRASIAARPDEAAVDGTHIRNDNLTAGEGLIRRPTIKRGDVPAFAHEIGWGGIPGEREDDKASQPAGKAVSVASSGGKGWDELSSGGETANVLSKSATSRRDSTESERRRRRAERDRAHRHQRSKDVSVLPPLLGVARPTSSANLAGGNTSAIRVSRAYSNTSARSSDVIAPPPDSPLLAPVRSNTPNLRRGSHSASLVGLHEYGTSPGRMGTVGSLGTSPRRAGLGWGALTPLGPPNVVTPVSRGGNSGVQGHATHHGVAHHQHHPHHHHHQQQQQQQHQSLHHHHHHHHHQSGHHKGHRAHANTFALGTIGMLGAHPHGNAPVVGRHSTTPIRMSTPRVPEDGGEMSAAQLKGEMTDDLEEAGRIMQSRSFGRRSLLHVPQRPNSVLSMRSGGGAASGMAVDPHATGMAQLPPQRAQTPLSMHGRHNSSEDARAGGLKMYPVLDVPNRPQTHDRYDANFLVDMLPSAAAMPSKDTAAPTARESAPRQFSGTTAASALRASRPISAAEGDQRDHHQGSQHSPLSSRKKLFYFDTS